MPGRPESARLPHLRRLNLAKTAVTDAGVAKLHSLSNLEWVNVHGTAATDAGIQALIERIPHVEVAR